MNPAAPAPRFPDWHATWDEVRDAPDRLAADAVRAYAAAARTGGRLTLDSRWLNGFGRDAGYALSHLAASRGKMRTLATLRDAGADLSAGDLDGRTPLQLLAANAAAEEAPLAAELGFSLGVNLAAPKRANAAHGNVVWTRLYEALRDGGDDTAVRAAARALVAFGGVDVHGRGPWHRPSGSDSNVLQLANDRGLRDVVQLLRKDEVDPASASEPVAVECASRKTRKFLKGPGDQPYPRHICAGGAAYNRGAENLPSVLF